MSSSDLDRAREISRRLAAASLTPAAAPRLGVAPPDPAGFVRLLGVDPAPTRLGGGKWTDLLDWTLEATGSEAAFLMDPHGLVVACRGPLSSRQAEGLGTGLMVALEQAHRMVPSEEEELVAGLTVTVQFGEVMLTGFCAPLSDGTVVTAGFVSHHAVAPAARGAVVGVLAAC